MPNANSDPTELLWMWRAGVENTKTGRPAASQTVLWEADARPRSCCLPQLQLFTHAGWKSGREKDVVLRSCPCLFGPVRTLVGNVTALCYEPVTLHESPGGNRAIRKAGKREEDFIPRDW